MTNYQLQYFVSVCELGSFTKAAYKHYVSQAAISQQMSALEKELGARLFYRGKRGITLTKAGEIFSKTASDIVEQLEVSQAHLRLVQNEFTDVYTIGYSGYAEKPFFPALLRSLREALPDIYIELKHVESATEALNMVLDGSLNSAFALCGPEQNSAMKVNRLLHYPVCLLCGPGLPQYEKTQVDEADLWGMKIFRLPVDRDQRRPSMLREPADGKTTVDFHAAMNSVDVSEIVDCIDTLFYMVEAGYGGGIFPQYFQYALPPDSKLRFVPLKSDPGNDRDLAYVRLAENQDPLEEVILDVLPHILPEEYAIFQPPTG